MELQNEHVVLKSRPGINHAPCVDNFQTESCSYPSDLEEGEVCVLTLYLSIDAALRCRMNESTGVDYMGPWQIDKTIEGLAGVGVVINSNHPAISDGDIVTGDFGWPWKMYFKCKPYEPPLMLRQLDKSTFKNRPTLPLTILGVTGLTAYLGIKEKGHVAQGANQTFVVSSAAGGTGVLAGQIARLEGCGKVVGICGSEDKCKILKEELGFDHAINYKTGSVEEKLREACPDGIDVYFDNVGGSISDAVIKQMNRDSHVILCGQISVYNTDIPYPPPIPESTQQLLTDRNITRERFLVLNYKEKFEAAMKILSQWAMEGRLKVHETTAIGLMNAGKAFVDLMEGRNIGKQLVKVADIPTT